MKEKLSQYFGSFSLVSKIIGHGVKILIMLAMVVSSLSLSTLHAYATEDTTPPTVSNFTMSHTSVVPGDVILFTADISDDIPDGIQANIYYSLLGSNSFTNIPMLYNPTTNKYEGTLPIDAYRINGTYIFSELSVQDAAGNFTSFSLTETAFTMSGGVNQDLAPVITGISFSPLQGYPGDIIYFYVDFSDEDPFSTYGQLVFTDPIANAFERYNFTFNSGTNQLEGSLAITESMPVGTWGLSSLNVYDGAGNVTVYDLSAQSVEILTNGTETTAPIISNFTMSQTELVPGDVLTVTADISDDNPVGSYAFADPVLRGSNYTGTLQLNYNSLTNKLEGTLPITEATWNGIWDFSNLVAYDGVGNSTVFNLSGFMFSVSGGADTISGGDVTDTVPPIISNVTMSKTEVVPGDVIHFTADIEDETVMGSYGSLNFQNFNQYLEVRLDFNFETGKLEGDLSVDALTLNGTWNFIYSNFTDGVSNWSFDQIFNVSFTMTGGAEPDVIAPVISNFTMSQTVVLPGDVVHFTADVNDDTLIGMFGEIGFNDSQANFQRFDGMQYNPNTGKLEGAFTITEAMPVGTWNLMYLHVVDGSGNWADMDLNGYLLTINQPGPDFDAPVISNFTIPQTQLSPGEFVYFYADITDSTLNGSYISGRLDHPATGAYSTFFMYYNLYSGKLEGNFQISEFMTSGEWILGQLIAYDGLGNSTNLNLEGYSITILGSVIPDTTPPVISNFSLSKTEVIPGDVILVTADISDETLIGSNGTATAFLDWHLPQVVQMIYNPQSGKLEGSLEITPETVNGTYDFYSISVLDGVGNNTYNNLYSQTFTVTGGSEPDTVAPLLSNFTMSETDVLPGDVIYFTADIIESTLEGSLGYTTAYLYGRYPQPVEFRYNAENDRLEGSLFITRDTPNGTYYLNALTYYDGVGYVSNLDISDKFFTVSGSVDPDLSAPVISNLTMSDTEVAPGDVISFTLDAYDESSLEYSYSAVELVSENGFEGRSVTLNYNLASGKYEGSFMVNEGMSQGIWFVKKVEASDQIGNMAVLENLGLSFNLTMGTDPSIARPELTFSPSNLGNGDRVTISIDLSNHPELFGSYGNAMVRSESTGLEYFIYLISNNNTGKIEGQLTINEGMPEGIYSIYLLSFYGGEYPRFYYGTDKSFTVDNTAPVISGVTDYGVYSSDVVISFNEGAATLNGLDFQSGSTVTDEGFYTLIVTDGVGNTTTLSFTISGDTGPDTVAPVLSNFTLSDTEVAPGDVIYFTADILDETLDGSYGFTTAYGSRLMPQSISLTYSAQNQRLEGSLLISPETVNGTYFINSLTAYDGAGNGSYLYFGDLTFTVTGGAEPDLIAPIVSNFTMSDTEVDPGDIIYFTMDITDNSPLDYSMGVIEFENQNGYEDRMTFMNYNYSTGKLEGSYTVNDRMSQGDWVVSRVIVNDSVGNHVILDDLNIGFNLSQGVDPTFVRPEFSYTPYVVGLDGEILVSVDIINHPELETAYGNALIKSDADDYLQYISLSMNPNNGRLEGVIYVTDEFSDGVWYIDQLNFYNGENIGFNYGLEKSFVVDMTAPVVTGVTDNGSYDSDVVINFNEGTATLNGFDFQSGSTVSEEGSYTLVVTDLVGNSTTLSFTITEYTEPDNVAPILSNFAISQTNLVPGDVLYVTADIMDSNLLNAMGYTTAYFKSYFLPILMIYNPETNQVEGSYEITAETVNGTYQFYTLTMYDRFSNRADLDISEFTLTVTGGTEPDTEVPVISNFTLTNTIVAPGESVYFTLDITDNSPLDSSNAVVELISQNGYEERVVFMNFNPLTGKLEGSYTVNDQMSQGRWNVKAVHASDLNGNMASLEDLNIGFELTVGADPLTVQPEITLTPSIVSLGDDVLVSVDITNHPILANAYGNARITSDAIDYFLYVSLSLNAETGRLEGVFHVTEEHPDGAWFVSQLGFYNGENIKYNYGTEKSFVIDNTAPVITGVVDNGVYNTDVVIHFNEGTGSLDGYDFVSGTTVTDDGAHTLVVTDAVGHTTAVSFTIDQTGPSVEGVLDHAYYNTDVVISFTEGVATLNDVAFVSGSTVSEEATYTLVVSDDLGNSTTVSFTIDKTSPVVEGVEDWGLYNTDLTISFEPGYATLNGFEFVSGSTVSNEGGYTLVVTDLAGNATTLTFAIDLTIPEVMGVVDNGLYNTDVVISFDGVATLDSVDFNSGDVVSEEGTYTLIVSDFAGNATSVTFTIDKTAPMFTGFENNGEYNSDVVISFEEGVATLNGLDFVSGSVVSEVGTYTFNLTDLAGNVTTATFTIDKTAPVITGVENDTMYNTDLTISFEADEATLSVVDLLSGNVRTSAFISGTTLVEEGLYLLEVMDVAGNMTTIAFAIDKTSPAIEGIDDNGVYNTNRTLTYDEGEATLNGVSFSFGGTVSEEGSYTFVVTDLAGNATTFTFTIDKTAPVVTGVERYGIYNHDRVISFNEGSATLNGHDFVSGSTVSEEGVHTLLVSDLAGNVTSVEFTIDKTAPLVSGLDQSVYVNNTPSITWTEGTATLDGYPFTNGYMVGSFGSHTFELVDLAGNKTIKTFDIVLSQTTGLSAVSASYNSITASWYPVLNAMGYEVYRSSTLTGSYVLIQDVNAFSVTDSGLSTNVVYYYKVRAYVLVDGNKVYGEYSSVVNAKAVLAVPQAISAQALSTNSIKVSWNAVLDAKDYQVYRATSLTGTYKYMGVVTTTSYTNTGLSAGTTYYYKVRAHMTVGTTNLYSEYTTPVSAIPAPSQVTGLNVNSTSYNAIASSWNSVLGASGYEVYRSTSLDGTYDLIQTVTGTSYIDSGLTTNVTHYYKVRAYVTVGKDKLYGAYSSVMSAQPTLGTPLNLSASVLSESSINLSWTSVQDATDYFVYRSNTLGGSYEQVGVVSSPSFTDVSLSVGTTYYYKVRASVLVDGTYVFGSDSALVSATPLPSQVTGTTVGTTTLSSISASWNPVQAASGYEVYRSTSLTGTYDLVLDVATNSFTDIGLTSYATYYYKVRAYVSVGEEKVYGAYSETFYATATIGIPTNVSASILSVTSIQLSWAPVEGAQDYQVYRATSLNGSYSFLGNVTSTSFTNSSLSSGTTYFYKVRARIVFNGTTQVGAFSSAVSVTPQLNQVSGIAVTSTTYNSIALAWNPVSDAQGYEVYRSTSLTGTYSLVRDLNVTSMSDSGLTNNVTYYYKVRAYVLDGTTKVFGNYSATVSAKATLSVPQNTMTETLSPTSIRFSWDLVAGVQDYYVYRATSLTGTYKYVGLTTLSSYTDTSLKAGTTYYYKVRSRIVVSGTNVFSDYSTAVSGTTALQ